MELITLSLHIFFSLLWESVSKWLMERLSIMCVISEKRSGPAVKYMLDVWKCAFQNWSCTFNGQHSNMLSWFTFKLCSLIKNVYIHFIFIILSVVSWKQKDLHLWKLKQVVDIFAKILNFETFKNYHCFWVLWFLPLHIFPLFKNYA